MNILAIPLNKYDSNCLYCLDSKPNLIMNGSFTKINYTHPHFTMNSLFFLIPSSCFFIEHSSENTPVIRFDIGSSSNKEISTCLIKIEQDILSYYADFFSCTKPLSLSMSKQFLKGKIKINVETITPPPKISVVLKISGIWENAFEFGLNFRWMEANSIQ